MPIWDDLALWRGPTPNRTDNAQTEVRGLVVHIAEGWYDGTIAWQRNPDANVSSHFIIGRDGEIAQMVDTDDAAWTQKAGNGEWLSVECEGFTKDNDRNPGGWEKLSTAQLDAVARLLHKCHTSYGVPLQTTSSATGRGLGHHSMGGESWGHQACPGRPIIAQKPAIVTRALALENGDDDVNLDDKLPLTDYARDQWDLQSLDVKTALAHDYIYSRSASDRGKATLEEIKAARRTSEAILAAFKGLNTSAIIEAIAARSREDAARDAELMAAVKALALEGASVDAVVSEITRRLGGETDV